MGKGNTASLQVTHGGKAQAVQLPKVIAETLPHLVQRRTRNLGISKFPRRHALQDTRWFAAGRITLKPSALRVGRFPINPDRSQTSAIQHRGLPQILYICLLYTSPSPRDS